MGIGLKLAARDKRSPNRRALLALLATIAVPCGLGWSAAATVAAASATGDEDGFVALFDGTSFEGWAGNPSMFRLQDKAIVGGSLNANIPRNEFLCSTRPYTNFELRLQARLIGKDANAGIQIRSRRIPNHHEMIGYQVDMGLSWGQVWWGKLYDESRRNRILATPPNDDIIRQVLRPDDWNDYVIRCEGRHIRIWLNDRLTVDYTEPDAAIEQSGLIGLQIHGGPPSEAWYRDVRIKELPPSGR